MTPSFKKARSFTYLSTAALSMRMTARVLT
jgi:hypothetical protein